MRTHFVYHLTKLGTIFYVGLTVNPKSRIIAHRGKYGREVQMHILSEHPDAVSGLWAESIKISEYLKDGLKLKNGDIGRKKVKNKRISVTFTARESKVKEANKKGLRNRNICLEAALYEFASR